MNVLSLFDGMSCGRIALDRCGIKVDKYYASEIDKHAIKVSSTKWPETIHLGSVTGVKASQFNEKIDLLIAGSPCQGFSNAGKGLNFDDPRSALFFEFVRILEECRAINPDVIFLLENVGMKKEWEDGISRILGIQPILINSSLLSAQNRERLFWTNISMQKRGLFDDNVCTIPQPKDKGIFLKHILQSNIDEKYYISDRALARIEKWNAQTNPLDGISSSFRKVGCLTARGNDDLHSGIKLHTEYIETGKRIRRLTIIECARLQTVLDDYFFHNGMPIVSEGQMYRMLGNGWTIDVICYIISFINPLP